MAKWTQVGTIRKGKDKDDGTPGKLYIKFHGDKDKSGKFSTSNLNSLADAIKNAGMEGLALSIEKPQDKIKRLASLGYIEEDDLERRLESIPDYIKYEITLPADNK